MKRAGKATYRNRLRSFMVVAVAILSSACAGNQELKTSQDLFEKGDYQGALLSVHQAQMADPTNAHLAAYRKQVNEAMYAKELTTIQKEYRSLAIEDLARRAETLRRLIKTTEALCLFNTYYSHTKTQFSHELQHVLSEKEKIDHICRKISDDFANNRPEAALRDLANLKSYKPYLPEVSAQFELAATKDRTGIEKYLDSMYRQRDFMGLKTALDLVDSLFEPGVSASYRGKISGFYQDKGRLFLDHGKIATSVFYYSVANLVRPGTVDQSFINGLRGRLKDYKESIHVEIKAASVAPDRVESYRAEIFRAINERWDTIFQRAVSPHDATLQIQVSLDRLESNVEVLKPQVNYSRFVSGYRKVPNQAYFKAKEALEKARSQLTMLASQSMDRTPAAAVNNDGKTDWQGILKQIDTMNSPEAFDDVPIYIDYSYSQTDIRIASLVQVSYKIHDAKNRSRFKEDSLREQSDRLVSVLEGVHPNDVNRLENSEKFDREKQKRDLQLFADDVIHIVADKVATDVPAIYEHRGKAYGDAGETAEAIDNYLMGHLVKNKTLPDLVSYGLPADLSEKLLSLTPETKVERPSTSQNTAAVPSLSNDAEDAPKLQKPVAIPEKKKYSEIDLPRLAKEAVRKVVLIRGIPQVKNQRGNESPFINEMSEDGSLQGSGFLMSPNGHVITNFHVVKNCDSVFVKMHDGSEYAAKLLVSDRSADIALLKIPVKNTPFFGLGAYKKLTAGETVIAIGSPLGLEQTISRGIVSAKRLAPIEKGGEKLLLIQTDTQMTNGNSGGPLINLSGEAIGINTLKGPGPFGFAVSTDEIAKRFPRF